MSTLAEMIEQAKEQAATKAVEDLKAWSTKFPEASNELKTLWTANYGVVGHKLMARELVLKSAPKPKNVPE